MVLLGTLILILLDILLKDLLQGMCDSRSSGGINQQNL